MTKSVGYITVIAVILCLSGFFALKRIFTAQSANHQWANPSLSPEIFTHLFVDLVKEILPVAKVKTLESLKIEIEIGDNKCIAYLGNIFTDSQADPNQRERFCRDYIDGFYRDIINNISDQNDFSTIKPVIKDKRYLDSLNVNAAENKPIVYEEFVGELYIAYTFDRDSSICYLTAEEYANAELSMSQLRAMSIDNLKKRLPQVAQHGNGPVFMLVADGFNEAGLLLIDEIWVKAEQQMGQPIVAVVPSRDTLFFTARNSSEGITALRELAKKVSEEASYLISEQLLMRQNGKWEVFKD